MLSVIAHLTSLLFVVWTAYCLFAEIANAPGRLRRLVVWTYLFALVWAFFSMR
jgi:hypothetical protein